jgi:hypothetical protein
MQQVFKLQNRVVRVMSGTGPRSSCRNLFKKLNTLPVPCQYILSLMLFIIDNQQHFFTNAHVHGLGTRNKNNLYLPVQSLTCVHKGVSCSRVKIFNLLNPSVFLCTTRLNIQKFYMVLALRWVFCSDLGTDSDFYCMCY